MTTANERAIWVASAPGRMILKRCAKDGSAVIGGVEHTGTLSYAWWAATANARVSDVAHSQYAAQRAVRRALREVSEC